MIQRHYLQKTPCEFSIFHEKLMQWRGLTSLQLSDYADVSMQPPNCKDKTHHQKYLIPTHIYSSLSSFSTVLRNTCRAISVTASPPVLQVRTTTRITIDQYGFKHFLYCQVLSNAICVVHEGKKHKHLRFFAGGCVPQIKGATHQALTQVSHTPLYAPSTQWKGFDCQAFRTHLSCLYGSDQTMFTITWWWKSSNSDTYSMLWWVVRWLFSQTLLVLSCFWRDCKRVPSRNFSWI